MSRFGQKKSVPRMMKSRLARVQAIASRQKQRAVAEATRLGIPNAYGSYDELLADPSVEAVYITLPNHLHVEWSERAARAGKHVLCEKPIALDWAQARRLTAVQQETGRLIVEAFMIKAHPQWLRVKSLVASGRIGEIRHFHCMFTYNNLDADNIRNMREAGGGALLDIGCYAVSLARWIFAEEPCLVSGMLEVDPMFQIDRLTSAMLKFRAGSASFTCATQLVPFERVQILGTKGRIEVKIPFKGLPDQVSTIELDTEGDVLGSGIELIEIPCADHFVHQVDRFCRLLRSGESWGLQMADAEHNARAIEAVFRSAVSGRHEPL